jgi:hypothetical protein
MTAAQRTIEVSAEELRALVFDVASLDPRSERSDDLANYDPSQPRVPGGSPTGGEFLGYGAKGVKGKWSQPRSEGRRDSSPGGSKSPPSWKPSMSRDEAEHWAKDSAVKEDLYHGTTKVENADAIATHGFDVTKAGTTTGNRGFLGEGVYVSSTKGIADILGDHFPGGRTLTLKANVRKVMSHDEFTKLSSEVGFVQAVSRQYEKDNPKVVGPTRMAEIVQSRGYDGVMFTGGHSEMVVFDPKRIVVVHDSTSNALVELREAVRNAFCPTGPGGGVDPTCSPKGGRGAGQPLSLFAEAAAAHSSAEVRERAGAAVEHVAGRLTAAAAARVAENVQRVGFHETVFAVEAAVRRHAVVDKQLGNETLNAGGAFLGDDIREVHILSGYLGLTGSGQGELRLPSQEAADRHVIAHEIGHAIDGPKAEYSSDRKWISAWLGEIGSSGFAGLLTGPGRKKVTLTKYAKESSAEGFAEFSRLLHGSDVPLADVERKFPRCLTYWRSKKLWP